MVVKARIPELLGIVELLVEAHDGLDAVLPEIVKVGAGGMDGVAVARFVLVVRPAESKELLRQDPVEVPIVDLFVVLVLFDVKVLQVKEVEVSCFFECRQTHGDGEAVEGHAQRGIAVGYKGRAVLVAHESLVCLFRGHVEIQHLQGAVLQKVFVIRDYKSHIFKCFVARNY